MAELPVKVLPVNVSVPPLPMAPPYHDLLALKVLPLRFIVPPLTTAPLFGAQLPLTVRPLSVAMPLLLMAAPAVEAVLPLMPLFDTVKVAPLSLEIAAPAVTRALLPWKLLLVTVIEPAFSMAAPPGAELPSKVL